MTHPIAPTSPRISVESTDSLAPPATHKKRKSVSWRDHIFNDPLALYENRTIEARSQPVVHFYIPPAPVKAAHLEVRTDKQPTQREVTCWSWLENILPAFLFNILSWFKSAIESFFFSVAASETPAGEISPISTLGEPAPSTEKQPSQGALPLAAELEQIEGELDEIEGEEASEEDFRTSHKPDPIVKLLNSLFLHQITTWNDEQEKEKFNITGYFFSKRITVVKLIFPDEEAALEKHLKTYTGANKSEYLPDLKEFFSSFIEKGNAVDFTWTQVAISKKPSFRKDQHSIVTSVTEWTVDNKKLESRNFSRPNLREPIAVIRNFPLLAEAGISTADLTV